MLAWIGNLVAGDLIKGQIEKLKTDILTHVAEAIKQANFKHELYLRLDGIFAELAQAGQDKVQDLIKQKREQLKIYFGEK